jgi:hypothetical protein
MIASLRTRIAALFARDRMSRADADRWAEPSTLDELGEMTAQWLEGRIASQPAYAPGCGPDEETAHLVPVLAAVNRAGYLTDQSQPGVPPEPGYDGAIWCQRAVVSGFASEDVAHRIVTACSAAGMILHVRTATSGRRRGQGTPVTTRAERPCTGFGHRQLPKDIAFLYEACSDEAVDVLVAAYQVTVIDPEWGRDDVLWPLLYEAVTGRAYAGLEHTPQETR